MVMLTSSALPRPSKGGGKGNAELADAEQALRFGTVADDERALRRQSIVARRRQTPRRVACQRFEVRRRQRSFASYVRALEQFPWLLEERKGYARVLVVDEESADPFP
ncbi:unnamed protein product [Prorocentrum cordatum]|uniref:Uncharacterized protein n=1 Tax=Prorocentrum cordatum TaxID=2364126 RepID=A0ABN9VIZ9_9DINO|nr:unnamed protein product [Polarella glacialis]